MKKKTLKIYSLACLLVLTTAMPALAAPELINYQGKLLEDGIAVTNTTSVSVIPDCLVLFLIALCFSYHRPYQIPYRAPPK